MSSLVTDPRPFYFIGDDTFESIEGYKPGGYHPVHLGNTFPSSDNPRYRVLHKLGRGLSSTVWLARDMEENCWVALKINVARLTGQSQEVAILKSLSNQPSDHPGANHVIKLLDSFRIDGPNGTHEVMVMDVFAPFDSLRRGEFLDKYQRTACYQLLQGLSFLQSRSIIHRDLHFGNVGCKIPFINTCTEAELLYDSLPQAEIIPVLSKDPLMQNGSLPKYIVEPVMVADVWPEVISDDPSFQFVAAILDFGNAVQSQGRNIDTFPEMPRMIRPPELTFHMLSGGTVKLEWTTASDVWSLACTLYQVTFRGCLFDVSSDEKLISQTIGYLGPLPARWKQTWNTVSRMDDAETAVTDPGHQWEQECPRGNIDMRLVVDLLRSMLRYEPADRPLPTDLPNHPWFTHSDI